MKIHDIAVIGGGIAGAAIARDGALRGLSVVLLERRAFGSGTSSKSSKLIHGGIRYLDLAWTALWRGQPGEAWKNFRFVFLSLRESRVLARIAPEHVKPHSLFIPIYEGNRRGRAAVFAGCLVYWLLALFSGGARMPRIYWDAKEAAARLPALKSGGLKGGVEIWDHVCDDLALVRATMDAARRHGADCRENAEVVSYERDAGNFFRIVVRGGEEEKELRARKLIDAAGPWVDEVRKSAKEKDRDFIVPVAGSHVWVKSFLPCSVVLEAEDGRLFFVIHFGERSRIGTTERLVNDPDKVKPTAEDIEYLLRSVARYFPEHAMTKKDVLESDAGVRPLAADGSRPLNEISREHDIRVSRSGAIHMLGVKLTDHRRAAEEVLDRLVPSLLPYNPKARRKTSTHKLPL